jgi:tRNA pseudouridine55 synthase
MSLIGPRLPRIAFRRLDGIVLLDKPAGMSSNAALQAARRLFRAEKGGHTGSLDPLATGLLPLCFGEATKLAGLLLGSAKAYEAEIVLGTTTDSDDADGAVLQTRPVPVIDAATLQAALAPLRGRIRQRAPIYSALKQGGEPLYAKARRGEAIEAPEREVEVHAIDVLAHQGERLRLHVVCGSGTYIRSLARDLGEALGCGAHIAALRRLWVEPFRAPQMVTLERLQQLAAQDPAALEALEALVLPLAAGLADFPALRLEPAAAQRFRMGQRLRDPAWTPGLAAVFDVDGTPLGLGQVDAGGLLAPQRMFNL